MELAPQNIIHKLLLGLIILPDCLILKDQIIVPPPLDREPGRSRRQRPRRRRIRCLPERGLEVEQWVPERNLGVAVV